MNTPTPFEQLAHSTIRIECTLKSGVRTTGTGFFLRFLEDKLTGQHVPCLVTNKHVVDGAEFGKLIFTLMDESGGPAIGKKYAWTITGGFSGAWILHPRADVDLAILPITLLLRNAESQGHKLFTASMDLSLVPPDSEIADFIGFERIVMVGYPNGIWDEVNNFPVFRTGVTASNLRHDWNGRPEFLIDAACFPGSSGSPVLLCDVGQYLTRKGTFMGQTRVRLLGILYAGPVLTVDGRLVPAPQVDTVVARSSMPINLGHVIKAQQLTAFEPILKERQTTHG